MAPRIPSPALEDAGATLLKLLFPTSAPRKDAAPAEIGLAMLEDGRAATFKLFPAGAPICMAICEGAFHEFLLTLGCDVLHPESSLLEAQRRQYKLLSIAALSWLL